MKQINALVHHIRSAQVVDALRDAGVTNITAVFLGELERLPGCSGMKFLVGACLVVIA